MNFDSQFPVAQANETQDEFNVRVINFLKVVINDIGTDFCCSRSSA